MRRIARPVVALSLLALAAGCQQGGGFNARRQDDSTQSGEEEGARGRFSRNGVPDRVMFRDQANGGFNDSPGAP